MMSYKPFSTEFANFKFPDEPILTLGELEQIERVQSGLEPNIRPEKAVRNVLYFDSGTGSISMEEAHIQAELEDKYFDLTEADMKTMYRDLKEKALSFTERGFLAKEVVDTRNKISKEKAYRHSVIRFFFHSRCIQAQFYSGESASRLFEFVEEMMVDKLVPYKLFMPPNFFLSCSNDKNLVDIGVAPKCILHIRLSSEEQLLNFNNVFDIAKMRKSTQIEADLSSNKWLSINSIFHPFHAVLPSNNAKIWSEDQAVLSKIFGSRTPQSGGPSSSSDSAKRPSTETSDLSDPSSTVPKWFKKPK